MSEKKEYFFKKFEIHYKGLVRYRKEYLSYEKQYETEFNKLEENKKNGIEDKQFENSFQETKDIFPVLKKKILEHLEKTKEFMYELDEIEDETIKEDERYITGTDTVKETEEFIESVLNKEY